MKLYVLTFIVIILGSHTQSEPLESFTNYVKVCNDGKEEFCVGIEQRTMNAAPLTLGPMYQGEFRTAPFDNRKKVYVIITKQTKNGPFVDIALKELGRGEYCFQVTGTYKDAVVGNCTEGHPIFSS